MTAMPQAPSMDGPDPGSIPALMLYRRQPTAIQSLDYRPGSLECTLFWNAPQNMNGVDKWRIFKNNENNLVAEIADRDARQATVKLAAGEKVYFYVAAVSKFNVEGPKVGVLAASNSDQIVVSGTSGGTSGSGSQPDPGWQQQPSGGGGRRGVSTA